MGISIPMIRHARQILDLDRSHNKDWIERFKHLVISQRSGARDIDGGHLELIIGVLKKIGCRGQGVECDGIQHDPASG